MTPKKKTWTEAELIALIRYRFSGEAYVVMEKVCNGTGARASSWIDAAAFSLWPSNGLYRMAFEVKIARSDFLRELKQPAKNAWAREAFHEFWYVAPGNVVKEGEVPEGIGWMRPHGETLATVVHAQRRADPRLDAVLLASLMRSARQEIDRAIKADLGAAIEADGRFRRAVGAREAIERFFTAVIGMPLYRVPEKADEIFERLRDAKADDRIAKDRETLYERLDDFQDLALDLLGFLSIVVHHGILARDEVARDAFARWGGRREHHAATLAAVLEGKPPRRGWNPTEKKRLKATLRMLRAIERFAKRFEPETEGER